jgi:hypothetical protein
VRLVNTLYCLGWEGLPLASCQDLDRLAYHTLSKQLFKPPRVLEKPALEFSVRRSGHMRTLLAAQSQPGMKERGAWSGLSQSILQLG